MSIEGRYRRHARPDDTVYGWGAWQTTPPPQTLPAVDPFAALEVERCMRHLPRKHKLALKLNYVYRMSWKLCCKRLSLAYDMWGEHLSQAQAMVANLLRRHGKRNISVDNSTFRLLPRP